FFVSRPRDHRSLPPFPTRRSSDLYAQYAVVPSARLVSLPTGLSTRQDAAAMLQGLTAHYLACSTYPLKSGDTCLVHAAAGGVGLDRKSTRLNSSHVSISYAVFCLK